MAGSNESPLSKLDAEKVDKIQFLINDSFVMEQLVYVLTDTDGRQVSFYEGGEDFRPFEEWLDLHFHGVRQTVWQWFNTNVLPDLDKARTPETTVYTRPRGAIPIDQIRVGA